MAFLAAYRWFRQLRGRYFGIPPVKATCCCMAIIVFRWWRRPVVWRCFLRIPRVRTTCCCCVTSGQVNASLSNYSRSPLVKATCCCVTVFCAYNWWRQRVVAWLFCVYHRWRQRVVAWLLLRVPLVKTACCCMAVLRVLPVRATCCMTVLCTTGEGNVLLRVLFGVFHWWW